jgi:DNA topoisomerase VI subunit B
VPLHPIVISILFHHYKELKECIQELERIEEEVSRTTTADSSKKKEWLKDKEGEKQDSQKEEEILATLDGYFIHTT